MEAYTPINLLFYLRHDRLNESNEPHIFLRITVNRKRAEIATKKYIDIEKWDQKAQRVKGYKTEYKEINNYLQTLKNIAFRHHNEMLNKEESITAQSLKDRILGRSTSQKTLIEAFNYHNDILKRQMGSTYAPATLNRYQTTLDHTKRFLKQHYKYNDIPLKELKYNFILEFETYFKDVRRCNHNTTVKYLKNLKKVINMAIKNEWLEKDPFANYKVTLKETKRVHLDKSELETLKKKELPINRLDTVRDIFLFACYTGLAFIDIDNLKKEHIRKGTDDTLWIFNERTKTKVETHIPLLPIPLTLMEKYKEHPQVEGTNRILPPYSNQRLNAYLKEIADICGIEKRLTTHVARHTFATTVTLTEGVSMETISGLLGHKNLKTTQIYAKLVDDKVITEMQKLRNHESI